MSGYIVAAAVLVLCPLAYGQSGQLYGFFGPGQVRASRTAGPEFASQFAIHAGGGGRYIARNGLGAGVELGVAGPARYWADMNFGVFSANGYYVFRTANKTPNTIEPFVTGGYSRSFGWEWISRNGANIGGGLTYWLGRWPGLMVEFRDHLTRPEGVYLQLWTARIGVVVRLAEPKK